MTPRRRGPAAGIAVVVAALLVLPGTVAAQAPFAAPEPALDLEGGAAPTALQPDVDVRVISPQGRIGPVDAQGNVVDERALRYYARIRDLERLEAEIQRLRALHPTWTPPDDLFEPQPIRVDETELWELFVQGDFAGIRARIADLQAQNPNYEPSEDLRTQLALAEDRIRLENAAQAEQWRTVISIAQENPGLLGCANVNNMWLLAQAFAETDQPGRAFVVYRTILETCDAPDERLATIQIGSPYLTDQQLDELFALERARTDDPERLAEIAEVEAELARGEIARALGETEVELTPQTVDQFAETTAARQDGESATLLGWYHFRRNSFATAETWFRRALEWEAGDNALEGLILTLSARGESVEAERLAYQNRSVSPVIRQAYVDTVIALLGRSEGAPVDAGILDRFEGHVAATRSVSGSTALGWYYFNASDLAGALTWFEQSIEWRPTDDAIEGLAVTYSQLGLTSDLAALDALFRGRSDDLDALFDELGGGGGVAGPSLAAQAFAAGDYAGCVQAIRAETAGGMLTAGNAMQLGWCLVNLGRPAEAQIAFQQARALGATVDAQFVQDATFGQALTMVQQGLDGQALAMVETNALPPRQSLDLTAQVYASNAAAAFQARRYEDALRWIEARRRIAPMRRDLMEVEAWSLFNTGRGPQALTRFRELDRQFSTPATREAIRIIQAAETRSFD